MKKAKNISTKISDNKDQGCIDRKWRHNMRDVYKNIIDKAVIGQDDFHGVVSIGDLGGLKIDYAQGLAERVFEVPVNADTRFGIASGTKGFTAIRILQLIEEGKLSLDTSVNSIIPGVFKNLPDEVTIKHVIMHTSGMPDYFDEEVMSDFSALWDKTPMYKIERPKDLLPLFAENQMMFTPGEKFHYNNGGFIALGLVIEALTGKCVDESITDSVFKRAEMKSAGFDRFDALKHNSAVGYVVDENSGQWHTNIYSLPVKGNADGGAFVNTSDMDAFWSSLLSHKIIEKESFDLLDANHVHVSKNIHYSLGFWTKRDEKGLESVYLVGEDPGVSFMSVAFPSSGIHYTILANTTEGAWDIHFNMYDEVKKLIR